MAIGVASKYATVEVSIVCYCCGRILTHRVHLEDRILYLNSGICRSGIWLSEDACRLVGEVTKLCMSVSIGRALTMCWFSRFSTALKISHSLSPAE